MLHKMKIMYRYNLELPPNSSVAELKEAVEKETNINPEEQMLLDSTTQMEMPPSVHLHFLEL